MPELTVTFRTSFSWWVKPLAVLFGVILQLLPVPTRNLGHLATAVLMKGVKVTQCLK